MIEIEKLENDLNKRIVNTGDAGLILVWSDFKEEMGGILTQVEKGLEYASQVKEEYGRKCFEAGRKLKYYDYIAIPYKYSDYEQYKKENK